MKKILFAALALTMLATVCLSQAAFAENFVEVDRTERNIAYLDTDSIKDNGGYLTAVTKIILRTPEERAKFKERSGLDAQRIANLTLALEEVFVNICRYAYPEVDGTATLSCGTSGDQFVVELVDHGQPFDPASVPEPELGAELDACPVGGLGWFLAQRLVDALEYRRDDGRNLIRLIIHQRQGQPT